MMYRLQSIDAWRDDDNMWYWNNCFKIEDGVYIDSDTTTRQLLKFMRRNNWLTEHSKGRVQVEWMDGLIEIQDRNTNEPILAFLEMP
jgi:hypothetical protein